MEEENKSQGQGLTHAGPASLELWLFVAPPGSRSRPVTTEHYKIKYESQTQSETKIMAGLEHTEGMQ